jgi:hypothetical protein
VNAAGSRAGLGQDAPGRDQTGKLKLDAGQLFTQVPGLPSKLAAPLPETSRWGQWVPYRSPGRRTGAAARRARACLPSR